MAPITSEGTKDFEKIYRIVSGKSNFSAHPILSKYCIESEDDFTNALSSLAPHPIALAFQLNKLQTEGENHKDDVWKRYEICRYIRDYAKLLLLESAHIAQVRWKRDFLIRQRKSQRQADIYWNSEIVTCILCNRITIKSYMEAFEWKKCLECKGLVCPYCDCEQHHLSRLTTLVGQLGMGQTAQHQNENIPRQRKFKPRGAKKAPLKPTMTNIEPKESGTKLVRHISVITPSTADSEDLSVESRQNGMKLPKFPSEEQVPSEDRVDFVQYLQETKSMIALAHLMDDLESQGYHFDGQSSFST